MKGEPIIRKAKDSDLKNLIKIGKESLIDEEAISDIIKSLLSNPHFYVIETSETKEIMGFFVIGIYSSKIAHLMILAVSPKFQKQGIGTFLLKKAIEISKLLHMEKIRLEVRTTNEKAINFYEKFGFTKIGILDDYYADGSKAYLMIYKIAKKKKK